MPTSSLSHPSPIKSLKLLVAQGSNTYEQVIPSSTFGNNTVQITNANLINAFNSQPMGTIFNPSIVTTYNTGTFVSGDTLSMPTTVANYVPRQITPNLSLTQSSITKNTLDNDFSLHDFISTNSDGKLSFSSSNPAIASVNSSGIVNLLTGGANTVITISQGASSNNVYKAATPVYFTIQVDKVVPVFTIENIPDKYVKDVSFNLVITPPNPSPSNPSLNVSSSSNVIVQNISSYNVNVRMLEPGNASVTVSLDASPDGIYDAYSVNKTFKVLPEIILASNNTTIKYTGMEVDVSGSIPRFIQADPYQTGMQWFAVVNDSMLQSINNYARGLDYTTFLPPGETNPVPFNNIVTTLMTDLSNSFIGSTYNQPLSSWDTSKVKNMHSMFNSSGFNQNISIWDVSNVENMSYMFKNTYFNNGGDSGIGLWNVSKVTNMTAMFNEAYWFNQNISEWTVDQVLYYADFRWGSALQPANTPPRFR